MQDIFSNVDLGFLPLRNGNGLERGDPTCEHSLNQSTLCLDASWLTRPQRILNMSKREDRVLWNPDRRTHCFNSFQDAEMGRGQKRSYVSADSQLVFGRFR